MDSLSFWQQKIYQMFHDPPAKPYAWYPGTGGHAAIAKKLFELFTKTESIFYHRFPDWAASGADRPVFPSRGKGALQMRWPKEPVITHPLTSGFRLDVRPHGGEALNAQAEIREVLLEDQAEIAGELGNVLKDWKDDTELKKAFFSIWRRFREELITRNSVPKAGDPLWEEMPADSRCPDHSIWDHLHVTTALCFMTKKDLAEHQEPWLFRFSIGPAQRFIRESRTSRDLWTSSFILSDLAWHAMEPLVEHYGPDCIIYPDLKGNPRADVWLASNYKDAMKKDSDPLTHASVLPNAFTAILPRGGKGQDYLIPIEDMAAKAAANVDKRWQKLEHIVFQWFQNIAGNGPWTDMWGRQHQHALYTTWSAVAWKKPIAVKYKESLTGRALPAQKPDFRNPPNATPSEIQQDRDALTERRDRLMPWMPLAIWARYEWAREVYGRTNLPYLQNERGFEYAATHHQLGVRHLLRKSTAPDDLELEEGGEKCTICGRRQALVGESSGKTGRLDGSRQATKKFWAGHKEFDPEGTGYERLCAVCSMKRFLVEAGKDDKSRTLTGINPIWAGQNAYQDVVGTDKRIRLPFPSTATIAAQKFLYDIASDPGMEASLKKVVDAYAETGLPKTNFPEALPRLKCLKNSVSSVAWKFLQIDPQDSLFPDAVQGKLLALKKGDPKRKTLEGLAGAVKDLRKKAGAKHKNPGTHLAVISMDGDHMGRLLIGDPEKIGACFKDVIHAQSVEGILNKDYFADTGWHDLLHAKRLMGPSLHAFISRALANFSHSIVPWVVENEFSGRLIYAGGDDILCLAPASEALFLAARLQQLFSAAWVIDTDFTENSWYWRKKSWQGQVDQAKARKRFVIPKRPENGSPIRLPISDPNLLEPHPAGNIIVHGDVSGRLFPMLGSSNSLSAGIVYSHFKTPMSTLLNLVEYLLDDLSKKKMGRNAVAMSHLSRNGMKSEFALHWKDSGEDMITAHTKMQKVADSFSSEKIPSRLPYKLREIIPFADAAMEKISKDDTMTDEEKQEKRKKLLEGFLQSVMETSLNSEALKHVQCLWESGIDQHKGNPERAVEGLLLAKALSSFSGGEK